MSTNRDEGVAPTIRATFVSTNSITQGEQVGVLWGWLLSKGIHIHFAHRLYTYARAFLDAAMTLPPASVPFEPARPFLVCHSIVLVLKAFLSLHGATMLDLGDAYGHKLDKILQAADEKGLGNFVSLTDEHRTVIRQASIYYEGKVFEYPAVGEAISAYPKMPALGDLFDAASILVNSLRQRCLEAE